MDVLLLPVFKKHGFVHALTDQEPLFIEHIYGGRIGRCYGIAEHIRPCFFRNNDKGPCHGLIEGDELFATIFNGNIHGES